MVSDADVDPRELHGKRAYATKGMAHFALVVAPWSLLNSGPFPTVEFPM